MMTMETRIQLRKILNLWDPLNIVKDNIFDEYDAYVDNILIELRKGSDVISITDLLTQIVTLDMEIRPDLKRERTTAESLIKWYKLQIQ